MAKVLEETKSRESADLARTTLETEIDNLTSTLFTEANRMVAVERIARARAEEKMSRVEDSTGDMAGVLEELQGTLREKVELLDERDKELEELKTRLEEIALKTILPVQAGDPLYSDGDIVTAAVSTSHLNSPLLAAFSSHHLALAESPQLSTSTLPYQEFIAFITYLRALRLSILARPPVETPGLMQSYTAATGNRSLSFGITSSSPASTREAEINGPTLAPAQIMSPYLPLSSHLSQPFLKRCVEEDSEPSLRLDLAPGLGFISRRQVSTAVIDGTILIEPAFGGSVLPSTTCCLCGVALERWWGSEIILAPAKPIVNTTMRKVLERSAWPSSYFSKASPTASEPVSPTSSSHPTPTESARSGSDGVAPTGSTFALPHAPIHQQIHIFRVNDTTTTRYAICPNYCLPRLRSVCDLWTYLRALEKGLLLEDPTTSGSRVVSSSFSPSLSKLNLTANASVEAVGSNGVGEEEEKKEKVVDEADGTVTDEKEEKVEESEGKVEESVEIVDDKAGTDAKEEERKEEATSVPVSPVQTAKPPVPRRSGARAKVTPSLSTSPSLESVVLTPSSPSTLSEPFEPTPDSTSAARLSPVVSATQKRKPSPLGSSYRTPDRSNMTGEDETVSIAWEDRSWTEVNKLKESVFWSRINAVNGDGVPVISRVLRLESSSSVL